MLKDLHQAWELLRSDITASPRDVATASAICDRYGRRIIGSPEKDESLVYRFLGNHNLFFALLLKGRHKSIPLIEANQLAYLWKIEHNFLPLHASAVIHQGGLYIFSAPSGTGKSTLAFMSRDLGDEILDEDQVLVYRRPDGSYSAEGWGYALNKTDAPVRGFFRIVQAENESLTRLSEIKSARFFWEQSLVTVNGNPSNDTGHKLFRGITRFSRDVPGYELHFRKSPDFWQLIDAEIPSE